MNRSSSDGVCLFHGCGMHSAASPMQVDDQSEGGEGETKEKKKGKGKEGVGGSGRCNACRKEDTECR